MRKGMWSAPALIVLLSGATVMWGPTVQAADNRVGMKDSLKFDPADITVPVNSPVVFHNDGSIQHDAKAEDGSFSTPLLDPGAEKAITFTKAGDFKYYCSVEGHKSAGMFGVVHVAGAGSTPTTAATTPTTAAPTATTATTAPAAGATTTTTAKAGAGTASSTTTTTAAAAAGATTTTLAPAVTPTSAPEAAGESTATTAAGAGGEEAAAEDHASQGGAHNKKGKSNPVGIAFAAVSTLLLTAIAGKLLASKP